MIGLVLDMPRSIEWIDLAWTSWLFCISKYLNWSKSWNWALWTACSWLFDKNRVWRVCRLWNTLLVIEYTCFHSHSSVAMVQVFCNNPVERRTNLKLAYTRVQGDAQSWRDKVRTPKSWFHKQNQPCYTEKNWLSDHSRKATLSCIFFLSQTWFILPSTDAISSYTFWQLAMISLLRSYECWKAMYGHSLSWSSLSSLIASFSTTFNMWTPIPKLTRIH